MAVDVEPGNRDEQRAVAHRARVVGHAAHGDVAEPGRPDRQVVAARAPDEPGRPQPIDQRGSGPRLGGLRGGEQRLDPVRFAGHEAPTPLPTARPARATVRPAR